jgi:riboflavin kinase/FMN adenylyltransferase
MRVVRFAQAPVDVPRPVVLAVGIFDGVHLAHQELFRRARDSANETGGETWALTFDPHPLRVLRPEEAPPALMTLDRKLDRMAELGVDGALVLPFTAEYAQRSPEAFIASLKENLPALHHVVVGSGWRFGHGAEGDVETLRTLGGRYRFGVTAVDPVLCNGSPISSTRLRTAVREKRFDTYALLAGEPYRIVGTVIGGRQAGRRLGYPTANVALQAELRPPHGVYAVEAETSGGGYPGAGYYGGPRDSEEGSNGAPTPKPDAFEVYLFDFEGDLYGTRLDIRLHAYVRPDRKFDSTEALKLQIEKDSGAIRKVLAERQLVAE